jgi:predicted aspartyl protease
MDELMRRVVLWSMSPYGALSDGSSQLAVWIDTAFNGFFVFPRDLIEDLGLHQEAATEAILADGKRVTLESYVCYVEWFGKSVAAQVIATMASCRYSELNCSRITDY